MEIDSGTKKEPILALIMGGTGVGKSRYRREKYPTWIQLDAGDIFVQLGAGPDLDFPGPLEESMNRVGRELAYDTLVSRKNLVVEIVGESVEPVERLIDGVRSINYRVEVEALQMDVKAAWLNNINRGPNNISSFYSQRYQSAWILEAVARIKAESRTDPKDTSSQ
jgi:hypothetical protein